MVKPAAGKSFDPTRIPKAVKDAGFSPREIEVTAVGTLNARGELLLLETGAPTGAFALAGGEKADELGQRGDLRGQRVRVTGKLHPSHADRPPGLTVQRWEAAPRP